jgi:hypothetical protein
MEAHRPLAIRTFGASQKSHRCCGIASGRLPIASSIFTQQRRSHALANSPVQPLGFLQYRTENDWTNNQTCSH